MGVKGRESVVKGVGDCGGGDGNRLLKGWGTGSEKKR